MKQNEFAPGTRFHSVVVIGPDPEKRYHYVCKCDCGATMVAYASNLRRGKTRSCGSHKPGTGSVKVNIQRGDSAHPLYRLWRGMINRCYNKRQPHYPRYGGRGIRVCKRWGSFQDFCTDMGERPPGYSLDRIDNNGHYSPINCRWVSYKEQATNKRVAVNAHLLTFEGKTQTLAQWGCALGIDRMTLQKRVEAGWSPRRVITTPVGPSGPKRH